MKKILLLLIPALLTMVSCETDEVELKSTVLDLPNDPYFYNVGGSDLPTLGRVLFYDRQLSLNNSVSCASCHKQAFAFADNVAKSVGFENQLTDRNSMPIQNLFGFDSVKLFWDGRESHLQTMVMQPIINHVEMGIPDLKYLTDKLSKLDYYKPLFEKAYFSSQITEEKVATALMMFVTNIQSNNTRLDQSMFGGSPLTPLEQQGMDLFITKYDCNSCHQVQNPTGYIQAGTFANIGLDATYRDNGRAVVTGNLEDAGRFKIPSLRNVALTAPYMHDGRFETLSEVMDHYSEGVQLHPALDFRLRAAGETGGLKISPQEKTAIIAFLNTLTDLEMVTDKRFSDPFKVK